MLFNFKIYSGRHFVDLGMYQTGHEQCPSGHLFGPASREHFLFHYVLKGKGTLLCPDSSGELKKHVIRENEGFLIFPGCVTTYFADADEPWEYVWIEFDGMSVRGDRPGRIFPGCSCLQGFTAGLPGTGKRGSPVYHRTSGGIPAASGRASLSVF